MFYIATLLREDVTNMPKTYSVLRKTWIRHGFEDNVVLDKWEKLKTNKAAGLMEYTQGYSKSLR